MRLERIFRCIECGKTQFKKAMGEGVCKCECGAIYLVDTENNKITSLKKDKTTNFLELSQERELAIVACSCGSSVYLVLNGGKTISNCVNCDKKYTFTYDELGASVYDDRASQFLYRITKIDFSSINALKSGCSFTTQQEIEAISHNPNKDTWYSDAECSNLYLVIYKTGRKTFRFQKSSFGIVRNEKIGDFPKMSLDEARAIVNLKKESIFKAIKTKRDWRKK